VPQRPHEGAAVQRDERDAAHVARSAAAAAAAAAAAVVVGDDTVMLHALRHDVAGAPGGRRGDA
jgi:hypothetical protein